jgi:hypothetical protein
MDPNDTRIFGEKRVRVCFRHDPYGLLTGMADNILYVVLENPVQVKRVIKVTVQSLGRALGLCAQNIIAIFPEHSGTVYTPYPAEIQHPGEGNLLGPVQASVGHHAYDSAHIIELLGVVL